LIIIGSNVSDTVMVEVKSSIKLLLTQVY